MGALGGIVEREVKRTVRRVRVGRFQRELALVTGLASFASTLEVASQHRRGSYGTRVMYTPVALSSLLSVVGIWAAFDRRPARRLLPAVALLLSVDGVLGVFFHVRGIRRKPGGWRLPVTNIVMGPPFLAPFLLAMPGYLGVLASVLRREDESALVALFGRFGRRRTAFERWKYDVREGRVQRQLAVACALSAVFSGVEALYSHYKNGFRFKAQWTPVIVAPLLALAGVARASHRTRARTWLPALSFVACANGIVGAGYHLRGALRRPGGSRQLVYNLTYGPPVFAPLLFAGAGFLGLLATMSRRERAR